MVVTTIPKAGSTPCMVAIGKPAEGDIDVVVYVDQFPLFCGKMSEAVVMLVASYYVFAVPGESEIQPCGFGCLSKSSGYRRLYTFPSGQASR